MTSIPGPGPGPDVDADPGPEPEFGFEDAALAAASAPPLPRSSRSSVIPATWLTRIALATASPLALSLSLSRSLSRSLSFPLGLATEPPVVGRRTTLGWKPPPCACACCSPPPFSPCACVTSAPPAAVFAFGIITIARCAPPAFVHAPATVGAARTGAVKGSGGKSVSAGGALF
jgi:hypothetical protein